MKKKECPSCAMQVDANSKTCPICQYEFTGGFSPALKWIAIVLLIIFVLSMLF
ncbi:MAG: hypothetical protein D6730_06590 [Bacteroidetes bacterium]|nr:MAG: hypothetical protein D6730_06590 [Bacteroidota bacterium]